MVARSTFNVWRADEAVAAPKPALSEVLGQIRAPPGKRDAKGRNKATPKKAKKCISGVSLYGIQAAADHMLRASPPRASVTHV